MFNNYTTFRDLGVSPGDLFFEVQLDRNGDTFKSMIFVILDVGADSFLFRAISFFPVDFPRLSKPCKLSHKLSLNARTMAIRISA